ncbi:hypothetical protein LCGC14_0984420 [marine sediment metagenome]|uniref:ERF family protein n=1 Tax=marine sediment metagenome TaxID=412755 RepID=A0A0F9NU07_9ZZZZ
MTHLPRQPRTVIERLLKVKEELGTIEKDWIDTQGGGKFFAFTIDRVYGHLGPLFNKHGLIVTPRMVSVDYGTVTSAHGKHGTSAHVMMDYTFCDVDGGELTMRFGAEGIDYQDKATNKAVQQAFKYALVQLFQLSTGDVDPDAAQLPDQASEKVEEKPPSLAEKRMRKIKDAAWSHTEGEQDARIVETKAIVAQVISGYGREPKNQTDVEAIIANIDEMFEKVTDE